MKTFQLIAKLLPIVRAIIAATKKDSEGGKKVTKDEIEDIVAAHLDDVVTVVLDAV